MVYNFSTEYERQTLGLGTFTTDKMRSVILIPLKRQKASKVDLYTSFNGIKIAHE